MARQHRFHFRLFVPGTCALCQFFIPFKWFCDIMVIICIINRSAKLFKLISIRASLQLLFCARSLLLSGHASFTLARLIARKLSCTHQASPKDSMSWLKFNWSGVGIPSVDVWHECSSDLCNQIFMRIYFFKHLKIILKHLNKNL